MIIANIIYLGTKEYVTETGAAGFDYEKFKEVPDNILIANTGSSHGEKGFVYKKQLSEDAFNFGMSSQTLSYDYRVIEQYMDHLESGAVLLIPISYFSLYGDDETMRDDFESKNDRYYNILDSKYIKCFSWRKWIVITYLPVLNEDMLDWWWYVRDALLQRGAPIGGNTDVDYDALAENAYNRHNHENENGE